MAEKRIARVVETFGYREVGHDPNRRTGGDWDGVETPGTGGMATQGWAEARATESAASTDHEYEIVRREIHYTEWEVVE